MNEHFKTSRRGFLKGVGAGLSIAIAVPGMGVAKALAEGAGGQLGAFIHIAADGAVNLTVPTFEIGQGSHTSLGMILADELGVDWAKVNILTPVLNPEMNTPGWQEQIVAGSYSVRLWYAPLRNAAAAARMMLTEAAAKQWGVPADECVATNGVVSHAGSANQAPFADLVEAANQLEVPEAPLLREDLKYIGKSMPRVDIASKVDGSAKFGVDVRVPDMVYAAIRQAPVYGASVESINRASIEGMKGVIDIVEIPHAVMVVADTFWRAKTAVEALDVVFSKGDNDGVNLAGIMKAQRAQLDAAEAGIGVDEGDAAAAIMAAESSDEDHVLTAEYSVPFLHHASIEPMTCTAFVDGDRCTIWAPSQDITNAAKAAAAAADLPVENVVVHATYAGGGFGRKYEQDFISQATAASKAVGRPVQLIWTREEDVQHGFYRPAVTARVSAAVNPAGDVTGFKMRLVGHSVIEHSFGVAVLNGVDPVTLLGISTETGNAPGKIQQYTIDNARVEYIHQPAHVPIGYWRSVGASHNGFFIDSMIDELAHKSQKDPYEFRRHLLRNSQRGLAVIDKVASEAGWGADLPDGRFRGIAFAEAVGSILAHVAEVSMVDGKPKVHRLVIAIDCGLAVNPDSVKAQIMGGAIMALSAALQEYVPIADGKCTASNFHDYLVLGMEALPQIDVHIINSGAAPGGVGESALPGVAPALANAIFAASGKRIRDLPFLNNI